MAPTYCKFSDGDETKLGIGSFDSLCTLAGSGVYIPRREPRAADFPHPAIGPKSVTPAIKKVLLTGANGYIGSRLVREVVDRGYQLTTLTRSPCLIEGTSNKVIADYDVNDLDEVTNGQDAVIHLAAIAHQPRMQSADSLASLKKINVDNTLALASAAKKAGIKRFIFISSIKAMGESTAQYPFCAGTPPRPEDAYGASKWAAEQGLHRILDGTHTDLVIIRPPLVWGEVMKGNLALLQRLISWKIPLPFGSLNNKRDLVSLTNLCDLICCVIDHRNAPGNTFLVSDDAARSTAQIALLVAPEGTFPKLFSCPDKLLWLIAKIPVIGGRFSKLLGTLEVDIEHTKRLLGWSAKQH